MKYYKRVDAQGNTTTVESYSHDKPIKDAVEITKGEYQDYVDSLKPPPPPINLTLRLLGLEAWAESMGYEVPSPISEVTPHE